MFPAIMPGLNALLLSVALLLIQDAQAQMPGQPYSFPAPDLEALLPFTRAESEAFRRAGVREIELVHHNGGVTRCLMNVDGRVTSLTGVEVRNDLDVHLARGLFRYDGEGRLLSRRYADDHVSILDSLAYDMDGQLTYYLSTRRDRTEKDAATETLWHLVAEPEDTMATWLGAPNSSDGCRYQVGPQNRFIRVRCGDRTDSVSTGTDDQGRQLRRFWYRTDDTLVHLGREEIWNDGRQLGETGWEQVGTDTRRMTYRKHFHYDEHGLLRRIDHDDPHKPKELFTYYDNGLIMEQVTVTRAHVRVERYRYSFGP